MTTEEKEERGNEDENEDGFGTSRRGGEVKMDVKGNMNIKHGYEGGHEQEQEQEQEPEPPPNSRIHPGQGGLTMPVSALASDLRAERHPPASRVRHAPYREACSTVVAI